MNITLELGRTTTSGTPMHWTSAVNAHLNISGQSGQRKTTLLRDLICQLSTQKVHVVVLDCAGDFSGSESYPAAWMPLEKRVIRVQDPKAPVSSMTPWPLPSGGEESSRQFADRIAGVLQNALRLGSKQWAYLYDVIKGGYEDDGTMSINYILERIESDAFDFPEAESLRTRLAVLADFSETADDTYDAFKAPGITVIDAQDLRSTTLRSLVTEIILGNLWGFKLTYKESCPMIVVLDECQHLRFDENSMAHTILREGRKYNLAGWFSSQWIDKTIAAKALSQAALQIYFRPDDLAIDRTAKRLTQSNPKLQVACKRNLMHLKPGQYFFLKDGKPVEVDGNCEVSKNTNNETSLEV